MNASSWLLQKLALFPSILVLGTGHLKAEEQEADRPAHWEWEKADVAGYFTASGYPGKEIAKTKSAELAAKALPDSPVIKLKSQKEWDDFRRRFAMIDKKTDKPRFTLASEALINFEPDFEKEVLLVLSTSRDQQPGLNRFIGIEVYQAGDRLRAFAFFGGDTVNVVAKAVPERIHFVSIPRKLADKAVEFRLGYQSWGRECSVFSPETWALPAKDAKDPKGKKGDPK